MHTPDEARLSKDPKCPFQSDALYPARYSPRPPPRRTHAGESRGPASARHKPQPAHRVGPCESTPGYVLLPQAQGTLHRSLQSEGRANASEEYLPPFRPRLAQPPTRRDGSHGRRSVQPTKGAGQTPPHVLGKGDPECVMPR